MSETTTNETTNPTAPSPEPKASPIHELVATGIGWAQYGLAMGRQSLEASARTLETAATFLGELSGRLTNPVRREEPPKE